jgi:hypothetical protein
MRFILVVMTALALTACGTPQAVRDLSTAQIEAIDVAIANAARQREDLVRLANARCAAHQAEQRALYAAERERQLGFLAQTEDRADRLEILGNLESSRDLSEARIASKNRQCAELAIALESQVEHLRAIRDAQATIDQAVARDDPLSRLGRRLVGEEAYNTVESRLDLLQTLYRDNQDNIETLTSGIFGSGTDADSGDGN